MVRPPARSRSRFPTTATRSAQPRHTYRRRSALSVPSSALTLDGDYPVTADTIDAIQGLGQQYIVESIFLSDRAAADGTANPTVEIDCVLVGLPGWFRVVVTLEPGWEVVAQAE